MPLLLKKLKAAKALIQKAKYEETLRTMGPVNHDRAIFFCLSILKLGQLKLGQNSSTQLAAQPRPIEQTSPQQRDTFVVGRLLAHLGA